MNTRDPDGTEVLTPTESRQASPKTTNFRVLVFSLTALVAIGVALIGAFWLTTPAELKSPAGPATTQEASPQPQPATSPDPQPAADPPAGTTTPEAAPNPQPAPGTDPQNAPPEVIAPSPSEPQPAPAP